MQIQSRDDRLARGLGWFSVGLGVAQLAVPRALAVAIGVRPRDGTIMRALGVRELGSGVGILAQRRPIRWLWARVLGDLMDLALLGWAFTRPRVRKSRLLGALSAVGGALALDLFAGFRRSRRKPSRRVATVTIYRTPEDVAVAWQALQNDPGIFFNLAKIEEVELCPAPGGRGTEVKIFVEGHVDATRVRNDLRRFKQVLETGEVIISDASIHSGPHAAQPPTQKELQ